MTKYLTRIRSASNPKKGLSNEGEFLMTSSIPAKGREKPSLPTRRGIIGAKKDEYTSWNRCPNDIASIFPD